MIFDATCSDGSCDDDRAFARELLVHRPTIRRPITVWNFMNFSAIHILREINFGHLQLGNFLHGLDFQL